MTGRLATHRTAPLLLTGFLACCSLATPQAGYADKPDVAHACPADCPMLEKTVTVNAPLDRVWQAWTTNEGLRFASAESNVELRPGGPYEWFLNRPADARGRRGSEGSTVLAFVPRQLIAFAWTFPPETPGLRAAGETTTVVVLFEEIGPDVIHVKLQALGWQDGEEWRAGWAYFDAAWGYVLDTLKHRLESSAAG